MSPYEAMKIMDQKADAKDVVGYLEARADWLKAEYNHGGDYAALKPGEDQCRQLAAKIRNWG